MFSRRRPYSKWYSRFCFKPCSLTRGAVLCSLISAAAFAQDAAKPSFKAPPAVEEALRARVTEFFQLHVEANFRKAYSMVAEDTKDYYFNNKKNTYQSFRITGVRFTDADFTKAAVDLECLQNMERPDFKGVVVPIPMTTLWKNEEGQWMWHHDPDNKQLTPMGLSDLDSVRAGIKGSDEQVAQQLALLTSADGLAKRAAIIMGQSNIDKPEVTLALDKPSSADVTFHNGQPGYIKLALDPGTKIAGFSATLDKVDVGANENAVLKLRYNPPAGAQPSLPQTMIQAVQVRLIVQPFNQIFNVKVNLGTPAAANR